MTHGCIHVCGPLVVLALSSVYLKYIGLQLYIINFVCPDVAFLVNHKHAALFIFNIFVKTLLSWIVFTGGEITQVY